jgi:ABC-type sugar transport system permease subunit
MKPAAQWVSEAPAVQPQRRRPVDTQPAGKQARKAPSRWKGDARAGAILVLPVAVVVLIFQLYPIVTAVVQSVQAFNPFTHATAGYAGTANFATLLKDPTFWRAFENTCLYMVLVLCIEIPLALLFAELINRRLPGSTFARAAVIAALAASDTVAVLIWNQMFDPDHGLFNAILNSVGIASQPFLSGASQALPSVVAISVWKDVGIPTLIFLVGMQAIDRDLYEAAELDGAGRTRAFFHITLPLLNRSTILAVFVTTIAAFRIFVPIILITQGGPANATINVNYYVYQQAFQYSNYGVAYAGVVVMLVFLGALTIAQVGILRRGRRR